MGDPSLMPEDANPNKRRRSEQEPDEECILPVSTESSVSDMQEEESIADVLPAGTFYSLVTECVAEAFRSRSAARRRNLGVTTGRAELSNDPDDNAASRTILKIGSSKTLGEIVTERMLWTFASIENIRVDHHAQIGDRNGVADRHPEFLRLYGNSILEQTRCLEDTCRDVVGDVRRIYQDEIDLAAEFAQRQVSCTPEIPCIAKMSVEEVHAAWRENFDDVMQRRRAFTKGLRGFQLFDQDDQNDLLATRGMEKMMFHRATMVNNGVMQYYICRKKIHMCTPWLRLGGLVNVERKFALAASVNRLQLDFAESYVALCLAFFRPGPDLAVKNIDLLQFLYAHYLDIFRHLVSTRSRGSRDFYTDFETVVHDMPMVKRPDACDRYPTSHLKNSDSVRNY